MNNRKRCCYKLKVCTHFVKMFTNYHNDVPWRGNPRLGYKTCRLHQEPITNVQHT